jgi:hypothetical protein
MNRKTKLWLAAAACVLTAHAQADVVLQYGNFASTAGLQINGDAAQAGDVLRLTRAQDWQSGSVFSTNSVSLAANASFSTYFQFRFTSPDTGFCDAPGVCGADGIVFVLQTVANNVGGSGGGIGYFGIPKSVGIEFDSWRNDFDKGSSNHVGLDVNGSVNSLTQVEITEADMNLGDIWNSWIDYNGATNLLEVRLSRSGTRPVDALMSVTRNIALDLGSTNAFVGFTSGTGASHANHDLLSWTLRDNFEPIGDPNPVPEPGSLPLALAGLGLGAVALRRQRKR